MKSVSIVVAVLLFSATAMMSFSEAQSSSCSDAVRRLKPCLSQIEKLIPAKINSSCCAAISEVTEECPAYFQSFWVSRAHKICSAEDSQPATLSPIPPISVSPSPPKSKPASPPPPQSNPVSPSPPKSKPVSSPPPQSNPVSPPEDGGKKCDISPIGPCTVELLDFGNGRNSTIGEGCCTTLTGLQNLCGPTFKWSDFAVKCLDYCHNHYQ